MSKNTCLVLPPDMTHNYFNMEHDLLRPMLAFFAHLKLNLLSKKPKCENEERSEQSRLARYFYPSDEIIQFEKTLYKNSRVWELAETWRTQNALINGTAVAR